MQEIIKRKCQGCAKICDRKDLIKITLNEGGLFINPSSKILGRSMYICNNLQCVKNVIKKKKLYAALKIKNFDEISKTQELLLNLVNNCKQNK